MTDLYVQSRILYHLYDNSEPAISQQKLQEIEYLKNIPHKEFEKELGYLIESGYVEQTIPQQLKLSAEGIKMTESLYRGFIEEYLRKDRVKNSSHWINVLDTSNKISERISQLYFHIQHEPETSETLQ